jgi:hypothetical protein
MTMGLLVEERTGRHAGSRRDDVPVAATAAVAAGLGWAAARLAGVDLVVRTGSGNQHVGVISALVTAVVAVMAAGGLLRVLERRTPRGRRIWVWVACGVLLLSLVMGPTAARTLAAGLALAGLHVLVAVVILVGALRRREES